MNNLIIPTGKQNMQILQNYKLKYYNTQIENFTALRNELISMKYEPEYIFHYTHKDNILDIISSEVLLKGLSGGVFGNSTYKSCYQYLKENIISKPAVKDIFGNIRVNKMKISDYVILKIYPVKDKTNNWYISYNNTNLNQENYQENYLFYKGDLLFDNYKIYFLENFLID